jgi:hypothetical protein
VKYADGRAVEAHKPVRNWRRWCKAKILYQVTLEGQEHKEAYWVEFADGSRGGFDTDHIRPVAREKAT